MNKYRKDKMRKMSLHWVFSVNSSCYFLFFLVLLFFFLPVVVCGGGDRICILSIYKIFLSSHSVPQYAILFRLLSFLEQLQVNNFALFFHILFCLGHVCMCVASTFRLLHQKEKEKKNLFANSLTKKNTHNRRF